MDHRQEGGSHGPGGAGPEAATVETLPFDRRPLQPLRMAAVTEAATLLLLVGIAVPLKHLGDWPGAVRVLGPVHGFAFLAYVWMVLRSLSAGLVSRDEAMRLAVAAFVPGAGFLTARSLGGRASQPGPGDRP
ncbi:DUF3817 domain-containing protein [Methylobacterium aquaticum]|nr:DUF3817 domain-containing protein [Methylobacterium aquaticum]